MNSGLALFSTSVVSVILLCLLGRRKNRDLARTIAADNDVARQPSRTIDDGTGIADVGRSRSTLVLALIALGCVVMGWSCLRAIFSLLRFAERLIFCLVPLAAIFALAIILIGFFGRRSKGNHTPVTGNVGVRHTYLLLAVLISAAVLGAASWIILGPTSSQAEKGWAWGAGGLILGYWLRSGAISS